MDAEEVLIEHLRFLTERRKITEDDAERAEDAYAIDKSAENAIWSTTSVTRRDCARVEEVNFRILLKKLNVSTDSAPLARATNSRKERERTL